MLPDYEDRARLCMAFGYLVTGSWLPRKAYSVPRAPHARLFVPFVPEFWSECQFAESGFDRGGGERRAMYGVRMRQSRVNLEFGGPDVGDCALSSFVDSLVNDSVQRGRTLDTL